MPDGAFDDCPGSDRTPVAARSFMGVFNPPPDPVVGASCGAGGQPVCTGAELDGMCLRFYTAIQCLPYCCLTVCALLGY